MLHPRQVEWDQDEINNSEAEATQAHLEAEYEQAQEMESLNTEMHDYD